MGIGCRISKFQFIANEFIFVFIIEADFTEIWKQFILADICPPGRKVFATLGLTEITVSDFQSPVDSRNHLVGCFHLVYHPLCIFLTDTFRYEETDERLVEFRLDGAESESAAQGVIYDGERAVGCVHATYQIDILGHEEALVIIIAVSQFDGVFLLAFVGLNKHHQFAQNLADVASIYLVDNEDESLFG